MRYLLATIAAALLLAAPTNASAAKPTRPWSQITRPPLPNPMPDIARGDCPGNPDAAGCYFAPGDGDVFGRVFERGAVYAHSRYAKFHELGHAFDATMMDADERTEYARLRGMDGLLWTWSDAIEDGMLVQAAGTPAEDFADAWASCRLRRTRYGLWEVGYGYYPTPREHHRVCRLIARAGQDAGARVSADGDR